MGATANALHKHRQRQLCR